MIIQCATCGIECDGIKAYKLHQLSQHNEYYNPSKEEAKRKDLTIDTIQAFKGCMLNVREILKHKKGTQDNDTLLIEWYRVLYDKTKVYNVEFQTFQDLYPQGIKIPMSIMQTSEGTIGRSRRKVQEHDRDAFHDANGNEVKEHECLLGSTRSRIRRERRSEVVKSNIKYW